MGAMMSLTSAVVGIISLNDARGAGLLEMPLSPEQEALCERVEKGEPEPRAAVLIRKQAHEMTTFGTDSVAPMHLFAVSPPER